MKVCINVETGKDKHECEDTALFNGTIINGQNMCLEDDSFRCIGVADGVGGNAGGRIASRYIAHEVSQTNFTQMDENDIRLFVDNLNAELIKQASTILEKKEMATTLTCVVATAKDYYLIHAGNTRLYVMQGAYLKQLTTDHTTYNWLLEHGQFETAEECNKSEINCCLGGGNSQYSKRLVIETLFDGDFPDTLVLTSDGIHEFVDIDFIEEALASSENDSGAAKKISDEAQKNGSTDDKTIIIVRR